MTHLSGLMVVALIALLVMSTASSPRDRVVLYPVHHSLGGGLGPKLTQKGGQEDQVEKLREITKPAIRRCVTGAIDSTRMGCGGRPDKKMWTYIEERNKCVTTKVDGCNDHSGNIFKTKTECVRSCIPMN